MKNFIEINGRKYDAHSGKIMADGVIAPKAQPTPAPTKTPQQNGVILDGVSRRRPLSQPKLAPQNTPKQVPQNLQPAQRTSAPTLNLSSPLQKTEKSKTLLRGVVKKPFNSNGQIHSKSVETTVSKPTQPAASKGMLERTTEERLARAQQVPKSSNVSKFHKIYSHRPKLISNLKVALAPKSNNEAPEAAPAISKFFAKKQNKQQVFSHPIVNANNHLLPKLKKERLHKKVARTLNVSVKSLSISAAVIAAILLAGFLAYQNIPSVAMRVAANRAGFSGHLPSSIPAGFSFKGPITFKRGNIVLSYKSNSDNRRFAIVQKPTSWTSESLLTNFLLDSRLQYQTYHDSGLTVYVYNGGDATWVDKGVWYSISAGGSLSSDQILTIASSM